MDKNTLKKICCPFDKADLTLYTIEKNIEDKTIFGYLNCTNCQRIYPIISGVPIMTPDEYRDKTFEENLYKLLKNHIGKKRIENFRLLS